MAKQISILEKFSETVKGIADSASQALKSEEPSRIDETAAVYMPFAAEGLVSDALPVPPVAAPPPRRKPTAKKVARRRAAKPAKKSTAKKSTRKAAPKSASARSKQIAKTAKRRAGAKKAVRKRGRP